MADGDTLTVADGVYVLPPLVNGLPLTVRGTVTAAPGARPILVGNDGYAPYIEVQNNAVIDGLWFGSGTKQPADQPFVIKNDTTIRNCTFFGYYGGIAEGGGARNTIQGCRFVECGTGSLYHALYISNGAVDHWTLIQDNVFIGGGAYAVQLWHSPNNTTIQRNCFGDNQWMLVVNGDGHLVQDNVFWSNRGVVGATLGDYLAAGTYTFQHNLFGTATQLSLVETMTSTIDNNTFYSGAPGPFGTNQHVVASVAGINAAAVDSAIAALRAAFAQDVATIHGDSTIESNFAICAAAVATWSP